jgi:hypothetical protein
MRFLLALSLLSALALTSIQAVTFDGAPQLINYQGRLTDVTGTPLSDGPHSVQFRIWDDTTLTGAPHILWDSGPLVVTTDKGLFTVKLGTPPQPVLSYTNFADTNIFLGITVGADPEISPRTRLTSVPFAMSSYFAVNASTAGSAFSAPNYLPLTGGTMTGSTTHSDVLDTWTWTGNPRVRISPIDGSIITYGSDNMEQIRLWDGSWGELQLHNNLPSNDLTAMLNGVGSSGQGGSLWLMNQAGATKVYMDGGYSGTSSVQLPDSAIDAREILDEPGIASSQVTSSIALACATSNLTSVTITIPAAGYIIVDGRCNAETFTTTGGSVGGEVGISESPAVLGANPSLAVFGQQLPSGGSYYIDYPVSTYRIFFKNAGTYTFYLNASKLGNCAGSFSSVVSNYMIKATYMTTSYGTVATVVSGGEQENFSTSAPVQLTDVSGKLTGETAYHVDLRELELKAARLRADAEAAQRQLAEARLKQQQQQNSQTVR